MKIELISSYYREEFLAPLFMLHYESWVDKITIITQRFPGDRFDDQLKMDWINQAIHKSDATWVIVVDFDEFVFPLPVGTEPRSVLEKESSDIIRCNMRRVWRHRTDSDVDRLKPPLMQRRHGNGVHDHTKACIFKPTGVTLGIGMHSVNHPPSYRYGPDWQAVHWANADPSFGITRTCRDRQSRLSKLNISHGWGYIPEWLKPGYLESLYQSHLDDPLIIG